MTRIVFVAPFAHEWGSENYIASDAEKLPGVTVDRVPEPRAADAAWFVDLIERCQGADLLLYMKGYGLPRQAVEAWRAIELGGTITASAHLDLYVGLRREREVGVDPMWRTQSVFTADGDPASAALFAAKGIDHHWLPPAVWSEACVPGEWLPNIPPVAFVGGRNYHDVWPWRRTLLDGLKARYGASFHQWGDAGRIHGEALTSLYRSAVVIVGDSLTLPGKTRFTSDRLPETLGRGGFLIHPNIPGIAEKYGLVDGQHCRFYEQHNLDDVYRLVDHYLERPAQALAVADAGQAQIRDGGHTYVDRAREILETVGLA